MSSRGDSSYSSETIPHTPALASGSSPSESGPSEPSSQDTSLVNRYQSPGRPSRGKPNEVVKSGISPPKAPKKQIAKVNGSRAPRASQQIRDRSKCYCPFGCEKILKDGTREKRSFTRLSDCDRHCKSKHDLHAERFLCPVCGYPNTRWDKAKDHWKRAHEKDGQSFQPRRVNRNVSDRVRERFDGQMGVMLTL